MKKVLVTGAEKSWEFVMREDDGQLYITSDGTESPVDLIRLGPNRYSLIINGHSHEIGVDGSFDGYRIFNGARSSQFLVEDFELARIKKKAGISDSVKQLNITAPMPGLIVKINCAEGDAVAKNQPLLVMEAMKMENDIKSPIEGKIKSISVSEGDGVEKGQVLVEFA
ncbi:MAG: biotin/lipoyl-containing protein [Candidatus Zixiibacteriota bacterium]